MKINFLAPLCLCSSIATGWVGVAPLSSQAAPLPDKNALRHQLISASAYRACQISLDLEFDIDASPSIASREISDKFPALVKYASAFDVGDIKLKTREYCPILFGVLSDTTVKRLKSIRDDANKGLVESLNLSDDCRLDLSLAHLISRSKSIDIVGAECRMTIKVAEPLVTP